MYIAITLPDFHNGEAEALTMMLQSGLQRLHIRKPGSTIDDCRQLIMSLPQCYHQRLVLHDHFTLATEFRVGGLHINSRNPEPPEGWKGSVSRSCHSLEEVEIWKEKCDYVTLSPIFDSISKYGYRSAFDHETLLEASRKGIIDSKVIALGGITRFNAKQIEQYSFGGMMVIGDAWQHLFLQAEHCLPTVLTIAGSDSSAGAGIQQDLKTITHSGGYATTVITAITSQNTVGVQDVMPVPSDVVAKQLRSVFDDIHIDAVKIGMVPDLATARVIVDVLKEQKERSVLPIVCDPVMISTSGTRLMSEECIEYVAAELFPLCTLVTPNIPEYEYLCAKGLSIPASMLLKGGHGDGMEMTDTLFLRDEQTKHEFTTKRINSSNLHGTGCTLSSAIATEMAKGKSLTEAVRRGKEIVTSGIEGGADKLIGHGNGPLWLEKMT